ncbi:MAG: hypothetical protein ACF8CQ_11130, partial [Rhodopirellula sp. JB044]
MTYRAVACFDGWDRHDCSYQEDHNANFAVVTVERALRFVVLKAVVVSAVIFLMAFVVGMGSFASEIAKLAPLAAVPTENREHALVVALITDDVSVDWATLRGIDRGDRTTPQPCWCAQYAEKSIANLPSGFLHPSAPIYFQHWPLGLPAVLTGGKKSSEPGRAFVVITDGQYRVLELSVGVPDGDDLSRMIGDAEDTRMWIRQFPDHPKEFVKQIADRNRERVTRIWRLELERQLEVL